MTYQRYGMFSKRDILDIERSNFVSSRNEKGPDLSQSLRIWQGWTGLAIQRFDRACAQAPNTCFAKATNAKKPRHFCRGFRRWQGWRDSNSQHADLESAALPIGATPLNLNYSLSHCRFKKTSQKRGFRISGGVDGTRTRDPRRDRPVF